MNRPFDYKPAPDTLIVGDPEFAETAWLPACEAFRPTSITGSQPQPNVQLRVVLSILSMRLVAAVLVSAVMAFTGTMAVHLGYDWGYWLVDRFLGQPTGGSQAVGADYSLMFIIMPLFFGLAFGWSKKVWGGTQHWLAAGALIMLGILLWMTTWENPLGAPVFVGTGMLFSAFGLWFGERAYAALRMRIRILPVVTCALLACLSMAGAVFLLPDNPGVLVELALYAGLIALAGGWAARLSKPRNRTAAVLIAATATLPFAMANLLNIVGNIICLLLDSCGIGPGLGWQALLSATFITLVAAGASTIGGLIGFRSRSGHSSLEMFENSIELKAVTGSAWPSK